MIQFDILSGKKAGTRSAVRDFPFQIGRSPHNTLQLEDDGVWDRHLTVEFQKGEGFKLEANTGALVTVNGESVQNKILRNGDNLTLGSVKLQFWIAAAKQRGLRLRESFAWALLLAVTLGQFALIYWLIR
jgi:pSer/pThr/pTyr-binding forkhead associated (FHA) protein